MCYVKPLEGAPLVILALVSLWARLSVARDQGHYPSVAKLTALPIRQSIAI